MKAGVAVGDVLQKYYSDTIWKLNQQKKSNAVCKLKGKDKQEINK